MHKYRRLRYENQQFMTQFRRVAHMILSIDTRYSNIRLYSVRLQETFLIIIGDLFRGLRKGRGDAKENIAKQKKVYINNEEGMALL